MFSNFVYNWLSGYVVILKTERKPRTSASYFDCLFLKCYAPILNLNESFEEFVAR